MKGKKFIMEEKLFDLIGMLEESCKKIESDTVRLVGRKEGYEDVINFIKANNLKITQTVSDTNETSTAEE